VVESARLFIVPLLIEGVIVELPALFVNGLDALLLPLLPLRHGRSSALLARCLHLGAFESAR
jgi:hypothetical protein